MKINLEEDLKMQVESIIANLFHNCQAIKINVENFNFESADLVKSQHEPCTNSTEKASAKIKRGQPRKKYVENSPN